MNEKERIRFTLRIIKYILIFINHDKVLKLPNDISFLKFIYFSINSGVTV